MSSAALHRAVVPGEASTSQHSAYHVPAPGAACITTLLLLVLRLGRPRCRRLQRYIIRIIFMVPVYAIGSFCSLQWRHGAIYFDTLRDWCVCPAGGAAHPAAHHMPHASSCLCCSDRPTDRPTCLPAATKHCPCCCCCCRDSYEAWIIYNFSALLLAYVGGPGAVVVKAEGKVVHPSWSHMTCCLPAMAVRAWQPGEHHTCNSSRRQCPSDWPDAAATCPPPHFGHDPPPQTHTHTHTLEPLRWSLPTTLAALPPLDVRACHNRWTASSCAAASRALCSLCCSSPSWPR